MEKDSRGFFVCVALARESAKNPISPREKNISLVTWKRLPLILKKIPKHSERGVYATHSDIGLIWEKKSHCLGIRPHVYLKKNTPECWKV